MSARTKSIPAYDENTDGMFSIPAITYHSAPGVSNSMLKLMARSPAHLFKKQEIIPTRPMTIGTLSHDEIVPLDQALKSEVIATKVHIRPDTYVNDKEEEKDWNGNAKVCKLWLSEHSDCPVVTNSDLQNVQGMAAEIRAHPIAKKILENGQNEQSIFITHPETGLRRKIRPDVITKEKRGRHVIADLKTTFDASPDAFRRRVYDGLYFMQDAYYADGAEDLGLDDPYFVFIAVESKSPHNVMVYQLSEEDRELGRTKYLACLRKYAECKASGIWPGYEAWIGDGTPQIETLSLTKWQRENA